MEGKRGRKGKGDELGEEVEGGIWHTPKIGVLLIS